MIKNVVFDMGNVLILFHTEQILSSLLDDKNDIELIIKHFYASNGYREVDRGTLTYPELLDSLKGVLPEHLIAFLNEIYVENNFVEHHMPPFPEMYELVKELKENGYKVYLLSNAGKDFYYYSKFIPAISLMDGKIVSSDYKLLKPEREIYEKLFSTYSLDPSECIFIDDVKENIEGSIDAGMDGIVFSPSVEDVSVLKAKLREKGIKI